MFSFYTGLQAVFIALHHFKFTVALNAGRRGGAAAAGLPALPPEALWVLPEAESFAHRVQWLIAQDGIAVITGDPVLGKCKTLKNISAIPGSVAYRPAG